MNESAITTQPATPIPDDDPQRHGKIARPNTDESLPHIGLVGDTYTVLVSGEDTDGRYCLIDMHIPPGGGPPPHRHDFEETFTLLAGEIEATFRGKNRRCGRARRCTSPPMRRTVSPTHPTSARMLCICAPAGQEDFFAQVGVAVAGRTTPPPKPDDAAQAEFMKKAESWRRSIEQSFCSLISCAQARKA